MKRLPPFLLGFLIAALAFLAYVRRVSLVPPAPPLPAGRAAAAMAALAAPGALYTGGGASASARVLKNPLLPAGLSVRVRTFKKPANPWQVQLSAPVAVTVNKGDLLAARFYVRRPLLPPAPARVDFVFEEDGGEYRKSAVFPVEAGLRWTRVDLRFRSAGDYPAGKARVNFRAGFGRQAADIGGFSLVNCGPSPGAPESASPAGYPGREPGAAWRAEAEARIERMRKGDLLVKVRNPDGGPAAGAAVELKQTGSAFSFGGAVNSAVLYGPGPEGDRRRYRETFLKLFNSGTIENGLKWPFWSGAQKLQTDRTAAWLAANGVKLRGHTLVWPGWEHMPEGLDRLKPSPEKLRAVIRAHVAEEAKHYRGRAADWDVLNEPLDNAEITGLLGADEAAEWFRLARAADPAAKLYVNEYGLLDDLAWDAERRVRFEELVRGLRSRKAPLDGIGLQGHFKWDLTPPARLLSVLDRLQALGLPVKATELDVDVPDEALQADYLRDLLTALFSHPAVEGMTLWTFWEGVHSEPGPALYRKDWSRKPAAQALEDLLLGKWRTRARGAADGRGEFRVRGFLGAYEVAASAGALSGSARAVLEKDGSSVTVSLGAARPD